MRNRTVAFRWYDFPHQIKLEVLPMNDAEFVERFMSGYEKLTPEHQQLMLLLLQALEAAQECERDSQAKD